jgi:iron complex outermembrane receptor protein
VDGNKIPLETQVINEKDKYFYHSPTPDITMGFTSKLIYKNFDFGFSLRANIGNYVYNDVAASHANISVSNVYSADAFTNIMSSALETNFTGNNLRDYFKSDYYVQKASFIRCDNITLGYSLKKIFKVITTGRIYATVQNPFVITRYKGLDPEIYGGIDNNIYPRPMITMVGLSLNF